MVFLQIKVLMHLSCLLSLILQMGYKENEYRIQRNAAEYNWKTYR
jgi:hypothetical protein